MCYNIETQTFSQTKHSLRYLQLQEKNFILDLLDWPHQRVAEASRGWRGGRAGGGGGAGAGPRVRWRREGDGWGDTGEVSLREGDEGCHVSWHITFLALGAPQLLEKRNVSLIRFHSFET